MTKEDQKRVIRRHYRLNHVISDGELLAELDMLLRRKTAGTLDTKQEHLAAALRL